MHGLHMRRATPQDDEILIRLAARLGAVALPPWREPAAVAAADVRAMRDAVTAGHPDDEVLLAEREGAVVGGLHMIAVVDFFGRRTAHISVLATLEPFERTGVARGLLAAAEAWARARQLSLLTLNVFAGNTRARQLYERGGFGLDTLKYAKPVGDSDAR